MADETPEQKLWKAAPHMSADDLIWYGSQVYNVPYSLALAVQGAESGGKQSAVSPKGARGRFQLMPDTAKGLGVDPNVEWQNVIGGLKYLRQLNDQFQGNWGETLWGYNAGPGRVVKGKMPQETKDYLSSVRKRADAFEAQFAQQQQPQEARPQEALGQPQEALRPVEGFLNNIVQGVPRQFAERVSSAAGAGRLLTGEVDPTVDVGIGLPIFEVPATQTPEEVKATTLAAIHKELPVTATTAAPDLRSQLGGSVGALVADLPMYMLAGNVVGGAGEGMLAKIAETSPALARAVGMAGTVGGAEAISPTPLKSGAQGAITGAAFGSVALPQLGRLARAGLGGVAGGGSTLATTPLFEGRSATTQEVLHSTLLGMVMNSIAAKSKGTTEDVRGLAQKAIQDYQTGKATPEAAEVGEVVKNLVGVKGEIDPTKVINQVYGLRSGEVTNPEVVDYLTRTLTEDVRQSAIDKFGKRVPPESAPTESKLIELAGPTQAAEAYLRQSQLGGEALRGQLGMEEGRRTPEGAARDIPAEAARIQAESIIDSAKNHFKRLLVGEEGSVDLHSGLKMLTDPGGVKKFIDYLQREYPDKADAVLKAIAGSGSIRKEHKGVLESFARNDRAVKETTVLTQPTLTTEIDSTIGPKGTVVNQQPITRQDFETATQLAQGGRELSTGKWGGKLFSLKTGTRSWDELGDVAPGARDVHYFYKTQENSLHRAREGLKTEAKSVLGALSSAESEGLGAFLVAKQKWGPDTLANMGKTAPTQLNAKQLKAESFLRTKFDELLVRLNEARVAAGQQPIPRLDDYFTLFRNVNQMVAEGKDLVHSPTENFYHTEHLEVGSEKSRTISNIAVDLNVDRVFDNYSAQTLKKIYLQPVITKARNITTLMDEVVTGAKEVAKKSEEPVPGWAKATGENPARVLIEAWADHIAGQTPLADKVLPTRTVNTIAQLGRNVAGAVMSYYPKTILNQPSALINSNVIAGTKNTILGLFDMMRPEAREVLGQSKVLAQREYDVVQKLHEGLTGKYAKATNKAIDIGMKPIELMDFWVAQAGFLGLYRAGLERGLRHNEAVRFADENLIRTHASASPGDISPIQRSKIGKALTTFQTFNIGDFNFIMREVFGKGNKYIDKSAQVSNALRLVGGTAVANLLYQTLGLTSPMPDPVRAIQEGQERGEDPITMSREALKEFVAFLPLIGSAIYGGSIFGPTASVAEDLFSREKSKIEALAKLGGVPGANVISRLSQTETGEELKAQIKEAFGYPTGKAKRDYQYLTPMEALVGTTRKRTNPNARPTPDPLSIMLGLEE